MMIGFGDDLNPNEKTLDLLDDYMIDFLQTLILNAYKRSLRRNTNSNQILKDDILYFIRKDTKKSLRVAHIAKCYENYQKVIVETDPSPRGNRSDNENID